MRIETKRLYIQKLTDEDFDLISLIWRDRCPPVLSQDESAMSIFLQSCWDSAQDPTVLTGLVFLKENDMFCGRVNMQYTDREEPEIGIDILKDYHNQGYGPEAITGFANWYGKNYHVPAVKVCIMALNAHSCHMFEKLGARFSCEKSMLSEEMQRLREKQLTDKGSAIEDIKVREYILKLPIGQSCARKEL